MTWNDDDLSNLVAALRADLPADDQEERLRRRLLAAGLTLGTGFTASGAPAAQTGWFKSIATKFVALPGAAKVGLSVALTTVALSAPWWVRRSPSPLAARTGVVRASTRVRAAPASASTFDVVRNPAVLNEVPLAVNAATPAERARTTNAPRMTAATPSARTITQPPPTAPSLTSTSSNSNSNSPSAPSLTATSLTPPSPLRVAIAAAGPRRRAAVATPQPADDGDTERSTTKPGAERNRNSESAHVASTLAEETRLLDQAFRALAVNDKRTAAALIAEHERRFPNGLLAQERERARDQLEALLQSK